MKIMISGLLNIETTLKVKSFPIQYYPIEYPFFGIRSHVSGVAYNIAKALKILENEVDLVSLIGKDYEGEIIVKTLEKEQIGKKYIYDELAETPTSIILFDDQGKRQIHCDLKDIQDKKLVCDSLKKVIDKVDIVIACNINFNRDLLREAKKAGKVIASDVHVLENLNDEYNKEFMQLSDILFLSDERLPYSAEKFLENLKNTYPCRIIAIGMGAEGALLYERKSDKMYLFAAVTTKEVVNTAGAGDALFAAFINFYGKGYSAVESLKRAELFASIKIGYNGASMGFSDKKTIEEFYVKQIVPVKEINFRPKGVFNG